MPQTERDAVIQLDVRRRLARARLSGDVTRAQSELHPITLARRWADDKRGKIATLAATGGKAAQKNALWIGLAGTAILLFSARRPISKLYRQWRDRAHELEE